MNSLIVLWSFRRQIMRLKLCILPFVFSLFLSCSDDFLLSRAASDYFPLEKGISWTYAANDDSIYVTVVGDSNAYGHFATVVTRNFIEEYWIKEKGEVKKFVAFDTLILGERDTIEMGYKLIYKLPLLNNATWEERELDTVVIAGDSFQHNWRLKAVCSFVDTVGSYFNCYKIEFYEERELIGLAAKRPFTCAKADTTLISHNWVEFLAPEVGVVKREEEGRVEILTSFRK